MKANLFKRAAIGGRAARFFSWLPFEGLRSRKKPKSSPIEAKHSLGSTHPSESVSPDVNHIEDSATDVRRTAKETSIGSGCTALFEDEAACKTVDGDSDLPGDTVAPNPIKQEQSVRDSRYDEMGLDQAGFSRKFYQTVLDRSIDRICDAGRQMKAGNYQYAVFDSRSVAESAVKFLLRHNGFETDRFEDDIELCRSHSLITNSMADKLHGVRLLGNFNGHCMYAPSNLTHEKAFFSIMQTLELLSEMEIQLIWPEPLPELASEWRENPVTIDAVLGDSYKEPC